MLTEIGKELRKIRIDNDENIKAMASKLDMSISYLSSIESGSRTIPDDLVEKVVKTYNLNSDREEVLRNAEINSSKKISIDLSNTTSDRKQLVFALARELNDIPDEECIEFLKKLKGNV